MASNPFDISGRLALVTGSSRGLGNALARGLAEQGAKVIIHGRSRDTVDAAARDIANATGAEVSGVTFDVTDAEEVRSQLTALIEQHGVPDILVNNAGLQRRAPFTEFDPEDWDAVLATNLSSAFYVSRAITPAMAERGSGKVVNIGSVQSKLARQTIAPYGASKGGVVMLTQGMAADLARYNIQVNCISPGYFRTDMNTALWQDDDFNAWIEKRTPAARWGEVEELVGTLLYLCSNASSFVSGQNILVDGGMTSVV
ncbi:glucose 1-dehydrogenase [Kushneria phosphatilytica]|uniref:Glucose 1-dehydrogenase n=1 Tax=Kushneria phosphatilytica TaxID=657387 RepID=A0A1S1NMJ9_9GAMM|nr:glucose 1-dehydrogenase [Kushneria phosphatilytica]OHV08410.1 gluconate 5-dehydrogenase [Kushneria phosphatilytica]QEL09836.1 glucose 1-dehydrogenase [Kushneria phosphatilytica]